MKNLSFTKLNLMALLVVVFFPLSSMAEYRVYQYYVKSVYSSPKDNSHYIVTSSLDPVTYVTYHGGSDTIEVDLLRTWTCEGYTGASHDLCVSPLKEGKNKRGIASEGVGL